MEYIANQVFERWYGINVQIEVRELTEADYCLVNEDGQEIENAFSEILFSKEIKTSFDFDWDNLKQGKRSGDWLGALFFLLSRMEEYGGFEKDKHGRFPYQQSIAYKNGFLEIPLVEKLVHGFVSEFFHYMLLAKQLEIIPTLDIDMTHAIKGRGFVRQSGAIVKDILKGKIDERIEVLTNKKPDPYDNFDYQVSFFEKYNIKANYFFQVGGYSKFDKNIDPEHSLMKEVLKKVSKHTIGVHPSYYSSEKEGVILAEKRKLEEVSRKSVLFSRQHFLKFSFPETFRQIANAGIQTEFSMGYSECVGFRASSSRSFEWYDLKNEAVTALNIQPFSVMDVALGYYLKLNPSQAIDKIQAIKHELKEIIGIFSFCFHNESLSEQKQWKGWRSVFEEACKPI